MSDKPSPESKKHLLEELDRRIRGAPQLDVIKQMERDQRNAVLMNELTAEFTSNSKTSKTI
jgi:hypothetical protein